MNTRYDDDSRRPSPSDLAQDAVEDERDRVRQARADQAARDRGEYVPSTWMRTAVSLTALTLLQKHVMCTVTATREGVMRVDTDQPEQAADLLSQHETRTDEHGVWVKIERNDHDPFAQ